jgi:methyl-accepting chemotaxis protein
MQQHGLVSCFVTAVFSMTEQVIFFKIAWHKLMQIAEFVKLNTAPSEENAASCQKLLRQSTQLTDLVGTYKF